MLGIDQSFKAIQTELNLPNYSWRKVQARKRKYWRVESCCHSLQTLCDWFNVVSMVSM